jgi:hypothetical protein
VEFPIKNGRKACSRATSLQMQMFCWANLLLPAIPLWPWTERVSITKLKRSDIFSLWKELRWGSHPRTLWSQSTKNRAEGIILRLNLSLGTRFCHKIWFLQVLMLSPSIIRPRRFLNCQRIFSPNPRNYKSYGWAKSPLSSDSWIWKICLKRKKTPK